MLISIQFTKGLIMKVSIIIPCYNAIGKVEKCLSSLRLLDFSLDNYEVIFVDDCSTDGTYNFLLTEAEKTPNWNVFRLNKNSGSPSKPRNYGIEISTGEYVFFLDCDDEIFPDTLRVHYEYASLHNACILRGYLITDNGNNKQEMNKISDFDQYQSKQDKIIAIINKQSTTNSSLIKKNLLINNHIQWNEFLRMGEDTVFLLDVLVVADSIHYIDHPTFVYNKVFTKEVSSTQTYGARELRNHLTVWVLAEQKLSSLGISYVQIRLNIGLQSVLLSIIKYYSGDIDIKLFQDFSRFIQQYWHIIKSFNYNERLKKLVRLINEDKYLDFIQDIKPRLLIAGYDLKFIKSAVPYLEKYYQVKLDEWTGHDSHDLEKSKQLLKWAEIIFCEWLLGNAVWYSQNKKPTQKLIIRMHRFEITRDFGDKVDQSKVDRYFTVSVYIYEEFIRRFGFERQKMRLIPNFLEVESYLTSDNPDKVFDLGIIGILPSLKGFMKTLQLLQSLVQQDSRYNLSVFGKMPNDLAWVKNNPVEKQYFDNCEQYILENNLQNHIHIKGWVDVKTELKDIGFILSMSDLESFHIAPADGFASGGQGILLRWAGVEYIYPEDFIFDSIEDMKQYILMNANYELFKQNAQKGRDFVKERYDISEFIRLFIQMIREII
jgi:glycosyltransferase involved in cell wall biosynthesis